MRYQKWLGMLCAIGLLCLQTAVAQAAPQNGWWWNPNQSGRGFSIEIQGDTLFMAGYLYGDDGRTSWLVSGGTMQDAATYQGRLLAFSNGQTLTGNYRAPAAPTDAGAVTLQFSDDSHGTLAWPGGSIAIERFRFGNAAATSFQPEQGWWWNTAESGRGIFIEIQGDQMFAAGYMYDADGKPVWYVSGGAMTSSSAYQGDWLQFANGQTLTGAYRAPSAPVKAGAVRLEFSAPDQATLTLSDNLQPAAGKIISIKPFLTKKPLTTGTPLAPFDTEIKDFLALSSIDREKKFRTQAAKTERDWLTISGLEAELGGVAVTDAAYASVASQFVDEQLHALANPPDITPKLAAKIKASNLGEGIASVMFAGILNAQLPGSFLKQSNDLKPGASTSQGVPGNQITASPERLTYDFSSKYAGENGLAGTMTTHYDIKPCPDAAGVFTIKSNLEISMTKSGGASGFRSTLALSITGHVNDNADLVYSDIDSRMETADFTNRKGAYIDSSLKMSLGPSPRPASRTVNRTGGRLTDEFVDLTNFTGMMLSVSVATELLKAAETAWKSGRCVALEPTTNPAQRTGLPPSTSVAINAAPRSKIDGSAVGGSVTASLAGEAAVAPSGTKVPADASFTYTAANTANKAGTVSLVARSKRGMAKADVAFDTAEDSWTGTATYKSKYDSASAQITWILTGRDKNIAMYKATGTGTISYFEASNDSTCSYPATSGSFDATGTLFVDFNNTPPTYHGASTTGSWPVTLTCTHPDGTAETVVFPVALPVFGGSKGPEGVEAAGAVSVQLTPSAPMTIEGSDTDGSDGIFQWKFTRNP